VYHRYKWFGGTLEYQKEFSVGTSERYPIQREYYSRMIAVRLRWTSNSEVK
jgi:hypothetical protein